MTDEEARNKPFIPKIIPYTTRKPTFVDAEEAAALRSADALEYIAAQLFHIRKALEQGAEQDKPGMMPVYRATELE